MPPSLHLAGGFRAGLEGFILHRLESLKGLPAFFTFKVVVRHVGSEATNNLTDSATGSDAINFCFITARAAVGFAHAPQRSSSVSRRSSPSPRNRRLPASHERPPSRKLRIHLADRRGGGRGARTLPAGGGGGRGLPDRAPRPVLGSGAAVDWRGLRARREPGGGRLRPVLEPPAAGRSSAAGQQRPAGPAGRPQRFEPWSEHFALFDEWVHSTGMSAMSCCLGFALQQPVVAKLVIGATSAESLAEIIASVPNIHVDVPAHLQSSIEKLIDPRVWSVA